ncbi:VENN motif pre-toxin domain-containing protein [Pantoea ananatis]|uniref:VENN motif pre-toxin domain-containing protein n=1 Tax=Pantoea ananas TaxID=553 RepID=UPI002221F979|nr:VENN motif pre-toxin domain-containing protein [Pantoea ananatis]MCW1832821.1 VENN motif pre-toxin domain-containing protein [Pantoea ananatis]
MVKSCPQWRDCKYPDKPGHSPLEIFRHTATLSRDTAHANDSISPIFNKEKEQQRLQTAQMIGEIGSQVGDIVKTQGAIEATRAANNDMKQVSPEKLQQAQKDWEEANPGKTPTSEQISKQAWQSYYDKALSASPYAVGGSVQRIVTAATAAVQGLASGDIRAAAAGGAAPYIANLIGHSDLDPASRLMAHAVVNAALAAAQDKNIAAGAAGAVTGELTGMLASEIYGKKPYEMNDREKETVSALATLAAGLSGGLAGSGTADMVTAAQAGKVTVENNYLSSTDKSRQTELNHKQSLTPKEQQERDALNRKDAETSKTLVDACMGGSASACTAARKDAQEKQDTYQSLGYQNQKEAQAGYQQIQQLLNGTSPEAKQTQELFNGMVSAYMRTGMSEEAAKSAVGYQLGAMYIVGGVAGIGSGKAVEGSLTGKNSTVKENAGIKPTVTAELEVNGQKFKDTNQTARPAEQANKDQPTLISDRVTSKEQSLVEKGKTNNLPLPNSNMANAHAEIGAIQQAYNAGKTQDANLTINVAGKDVCSYCRGDIAAAAQASGAKSVTINAVDDKTGLPKTYVWEPGMKSIREIKK